MSTRSLIAAAIVTGIAALPAAIMAQPSDLQIQANGFNRIVVGSLKGGTCHVHRMSGGMNAFCTQGARGTLTLYRHYGEAPACELDFWFQYAGQGAPKWRAQLAHQNNGSCALQWVNANSLGVTAGS